MTTRAEKSISQGGLPRLVAAALAAVALAAALGCGPPLPSRRRPLEPPPPVTTIDGEVIGVDRTPPEQHLQRSLRLTLRAGRSASAGDRTGSGDPDPIVVELAPQWYLEENGLRFVPNDRLVVEGTRTQEGVLEARRVRKGPTSLELRNEAGKPVWRAPRSGSE
jgi:hypothetical protein